MIRNLLLILLISLANWNCRYINNSKAQNTGVSENIILIALKERTDLEFDNKTRALHTIVNDSSKFNSNSLKRIYEYKKGSIFVLPGEKENFLVAIVNEKNPKIDINSKKYKDYVKKTKELYVAQIYKSYDKYINQSYKIDIKANVLKRIENSF